MFGRLSLKINPLVAIVLLLSILTPVLVLPKKAEAIPVFVEGGWLPQLDAIIGTTSAETNQTLFQWAQTFVLETLKKRILDVMVDEIINWVQGDGDPKFITDWQGFLADAGNIAAGDFAQAIGLADLCSPFAAQLRLEFSQKPPKLGGDLLACTLDDIVENIENFAEDFSNGGWIAYRESLRPQNNFIGAYIIAQSAQIATIAAAQHAAELEGLAGDGILSTKMCDEKPFSESTDIDKDGKKGDIASSCRITTPGTVIGDLVGEAVTTDFKYILSATQLADYVARISDALFNRLIREGVGGLQSLTTPSAPNDGYIAEPNIDEECTVLGSQELISICNGYARGNLSVIRSNLLSQIEDAREELIRIRGEMMLLKATVDDLNAFITGESTATNTECVAKVLTPYFLTPSPAGVAANAQDIKQQLATTDANIVLLDTYRLRLEAISTTRLADLTVLTTEIQNQLATILPDKDELENIKNQRERLTEAAPKIKRNIRLCL